MEIIHTIGRRKSAIARVFMKPGNGTITVNNKDYKEYFPTGPLQYLANQAQEISNVKDMYDVTANIQGGGVNGQAEALRLGIARALVKVNPEYKPALRAKGLMTRDPREVERKKVGRHKARKGTQYSKR